MFCAFSPREIFRNKRGVATLPIILLIGGVMIEIGIAGAFIAYFLNQSGFGAKLSADALTAARAGIQDAELRIVRNKNFIPSPNPYAITVGSNSAQVTVCKDLKTVTTPCDTAMVGKFEITSLGSALTKRRQLRVIVNVDVTTGEVKLESEKEVSL